MRVRFLDGQVHLLADLGLEHVIASADVAAGVDHAEQHTVPFGLAVVPIARGAGHVVRDGLLAFDEPVEERALTHVGTTYDRDDVSHVLRVRGSSRSHDHATYHQYPYFFSLPSFSRQSGSTFTFRSRKTLLVDVLRDGDPRIGPQAAQAHRRLCR